MNPEIYVFGAGGKIFTLTARGHFMYQQQPDFKDKNSVTVEY